MVVRERRRKTSRKTRYNTRRRVERQTRRVKKRHSKHVKKRRRKTNKTNKMNRKRGKRSYKKYSRERIIQEGGMFRSCCGVGQKSQTHPSSRRPAQRIAFDGVPEINPHTDVIIDLRHSLRATLERYISQGKIVEINEGNIKDAFEALTNAKKFISEIELLDPGYLFDENNPLRKLTDELEQKISESGLLDNLLAQQKAEEERRAAEKAEEERRAAEKAEEERLKAEQQMREEARRQAAKEWAELGMGLKQAVEREKAERLKQKKREMERNEIERFMHRVASSYDLSYLGGNIDVLVKKIFDENEENLRILNNNKNFDEIVGVVELGIEADMDEYKSLQQEKNLSRLPGQLGSDAIQVPVDQFK